MMKALKAGLIVLGLLSQNSLRSDTYNFGVSCTANVGGSGQRGASQGLGYDSDTNTIRMLKCDANGNLLVSSGVPVSWTSAVSGPVSVTNSASTCTYFTMAAVTYASSVAGTSMQYLTLTPMSSLFIDNVTAGSLYFVLTNSATAPTNTATNRLSVPTLQQLNLNMRNGSLAMGYNFLHWINANALTPTAQLTY